MASSGSSAPRLVKLAALGALLLLASAVCPAAAGVGHFKKGMHKGKRGMHKRKGMHKRGPAARMRLLSRPFGTFQGQPVTLYTLRIGKTSVDISDFGATLVSMRVPNRRGRTADVTAGFSYSANYSAANYGNLGCVLGRYGGRIGGHSFKIGSQVYKLDANSGNNTLHGGFNSFCFKLWKAQPVVDSSRAGQRSLSLVLTLTSPAGESGFPGTLSVTARYTLTGTGSLVLHMEATTDRPTYVNLVHHPYWNLNGARPATDLRATAANHVVQIFASKYTPLNPDSIPTGAISPVQGTPYDFRQPTVLGRVIGSVGGYDNNFVLDMPAGQKMWPAVSLRDPASGRTLKIYTNQPGLQFYSGNWLDVIGKGGVQYTHQSFLAFETQHFPDSPNKPNFPSTLLLPGQKYEHSIIYEFSS